MEVVARLQAYCADAVKISPPSGVVRKGHALGKPSNYFNNLSAATLAGYASCQPGRQQV